MEKMLDFYKQTSMFTDLGKYKEDAIDLWENKCKKSLKELQHYLMSVTIHRVIIQQALIDGSAKYFEYGDLSKIDFKTPVCEDDIFLTATSIFNEIYRRDNKGFYFERPFENKLVLTCRYISVLTSAILKANGIPCRSRAGWARYLREGKCLDHWVNEYWNEKEQRWIMFDMDDLYDPDFMKYKLYAKNKISENGLCVYHGGHYGTRVCVLQSVCDKRQYVHAAYGRAVRACGDTRNGRCFGTGKGCARLGSDTYRIRSGEHT